MSNSFFMDRIRSFFGLHSEPPRNDFRNPIWGTDDEDDGVELNKESIDLLLEVSKNMQDIFTNITGMVGDWKVILDKGDSYDYKEITTEFPTSDYQLENFDSNSIRNQYLKPGYDDSKPMQDEDLDGKLSSQDISRLLFQEKNHQFVQTFPFSGSMIPEASFYTTIVTKVTKPDGTIETRTTVKHGNEVIEDKTTTKKLNDIIYLPFINPFKH